MKKIIGIILASLGGVILLFILFNFPFIIMHSETEITEEDKLMIEEYVIDTFGEKLELVKYERYSNAAGGKKKIAIYKVNNREFEVGLYMDSKDEWQIYDTFESDYILGIDENLSRQIPEQLQDNYSEGSINYIVSFDKENTDARLNAYKKDIKNLTREEMLYKEKDNIAVHYWVEVSPKNNMEDFETAIYELYKVMKSSGMGNIRILVEFGGGNYQTGVFDFEQGSDYPVNSPEDLRKFYREVKR